MVAGLAAPLALRAAGSPPQAAPSHSPQVEEGLPQLRLSRDLQMKQPVTLQESNLPPAPPPEAGTLQLTPTGWGGTAAPPPTRVARSPSPRGAAAGKPAPKIESLLLDLLVNGQRQSGTARAEQLSDGSLLLAADAWAEARLLPLADIRQLKDGSPAYALGSLPGAMYRINRQNLSMDIEAPPAAFVRSKLGLRDGDAAMPERPDTGAVLNYDASLSRAGGSASATRVGAVLEAIAFSRYGHFSASALVEDDGSKRRLERLDTYWRYDMPDRLETLVLGDTVGVAGGWSRPARYGGVRWGRNFGQRPGFLTFPQVTLNGEAALPSTVDVLVNNAKRSSQQVPPGPFELGQVPLITGAGVINLVVRDLLGRETIVQQSFYAAPQLLAAGLTDFSFEAGALRTGYGQDSHYGPAFGAATWRQGLNNRFTGEARMELQAKRRAAGTELSGLLGQWGVGRLALAASSSSTQGVAEQGQLLALALERTTPFGGGSVQHQRTSRGFAPLGEAISPLASSQRARQSWLANTGGVLWGALTGGLSYASQSRWDGDLVKTAGLSLSMPLPGRVSVSLSVSKRLDSDKSWRAGIHLTMPLENGIQVAARTELSGGGKASTGGGSTGARSQTTLTAARHAPAGTGFGWRTEVSTVDSQRARAGLQYNTRYGEMALDIASANGGQVATRAGARGSVGWLAGMPFAARPVGPGSFAVVQVGGLEGVPVKYSNQVVAHTDSRGMAFIPGLLPWQQNLIEIDTTDLPMDTETSTTSQEVTPYAGSGRVVRFALKRSRQALVVLHGADGQPLPVGTQVQLLPGGPVFVAGRRGEVWLTGLATGSQRLAASWPAGRCELELPPAAADENAPPKIGPLTCGSQ